MPNYKINIDKPLPDPQRIRGYQNFDSLYAQYQVNARFTFWKNLYRNPRYFAGLAAVVAIVVLMFRAVTQEEIAEIAYVNPPVAQQDLPFASVAFEAEQPLTFESSQFTRLYLPADAFVDAQGQAVTGPLELRYREFRSLEDYFRAGIPLEYDSADQALQLIALAGLEVAAFQGEQALQLKSGVALEVQLRSEQGGTQYSHYALDREARNWRWQGKDKVEAVPVELPPRPERPAALLAMNTTEMTPRNAMPPFRPGRPFGVKVRNSEDFREFAGYEKIYWEYLEGPGSDNPWESGLISENGEQAWQDVRIERMNGDRYRLTFARQNANGNLEFRRVVARVLFEARSQADANRYYQAQQESYQQEYADWEAAREKTRQQRQEKERLERAYQQQVRQWENQVAQAQDTIAQQPSLFRRSFTVQSMGIHQLAYPITRPTQLMGLLLLDENEHLLASTLIEAGQQPVLFTSNAGTLYRSQWVEDSLKIPVVAESWTLLMGLSETDFAYLDQEQWKQAEENLQVQVLTFPMTALEEQLKRLEGISPPIE